MYDNIIPLILANTFGMKETVTGVVMAADNVLAIVLLPVFGTLSDKVNTRWGKRTPFIVIGTTLAVIFLMMLPIADKMVNLPLFVGALFGALLAMGFYRSPAVALMPDLTPNRLRSKANSVINLMGAIGGVYALIMIKLLVGKGDRPDYQPLFISVAALMVIAVVVLVITIREKKIAAQVAEEEASLAKAMEESGEKSNLTDTSVASEDASSMPKEVKRSFIFMLMSILFWFMAYNAVTTAFSRYTKVVWKLEGGGFADCLMVATVFAIISYIPIGIVASKIGRKKTIMGGIILMASCFAMAIFMGEFHPIINVGFALIGIGWAAIGVNSYPMIVAMASGNNIGKFTGTYYTFSMAAQICTPILSGLLLEHVSYRTLFPYALVFSILAFITMTQVKHGDVKAEKKTSLIEHFDVDD